MPKVNKEKCIGCNLCVNICPVKAISLKDGKAVIDTQKCISCGKCFPVCPTKAIEHGCMNQHHHKNLE